MTTTPFPTRRRLAASITVALLALAPVACSAGESDRAEAKSAAGSASATTAPGAQDPDAADDSSAGTDEGDDDPTATGTETGGGGELPTLDVLASARGALRADPADNTLVALRLDVHSLERRPGDTVTVRFSIANVDDTATFEPWSELAEEGGRYDVGAVALLDLPGDKRYLVLRDTEDACLCTDGLDAAAIAPGESAPFSAQFPAPPDDVTTVDLTVPGFDPVDGLELS